MNNVQPKGVTIRRDPIYLSTEVWRCLWIVAKAKETTPDELADNLLRESLNGIYPEVVKHHAEVTRMERSVIRDIGMKGNK